MSDFYRPIFRNVLFPLYEGVFRRRKTLAYLQDFQSHLSWTPEKVKQYQWQQLELLLEYCYQNVPYYQKLWRSLGIQSTQDIKNLDDFSKLPGLSKDDISCHYSDLVSDSSNVKNIHKATGGSTGKPFRFEYNVESDESRQAIMWRGYGWLNAGLGVKSLHLWGADIGHVSGFKKFKTALYHRYYNRKIISSFNMREDNMQSYIDEINQYKPDALVAYVNPIYQLAKHIIDNKMSVFSPGRIVTGAEALHEFQRELIEMAFNCPVYNTYGCREFMSIAVECKEEKKLHINADQLLVETINDEGESIMDEPGDVVITDLSNFGMPLIRYMNGDRAVLSKQPCSCGNPLPIMEKVEGRKLDIIKTPQGGKIPGIFFPHLFKEFIGVERFQVRQKKISEIDILMVVNEQFSKNNEKQIEDEFKKYTMGSVKINFFKVDDIPLTASGKYRVTICEIADE